MKILPAAVPLHPARDRSLLLHLFPSVFPDTPQPFPLHSLTVLENKSKTPVVILGVLFLFIVLFLCHTVVLPLLFCVPSARVWLTLFLDGICSSNNLCGSCQLIRRADHSDLHVSCSWSAAESSVPARLARFASDAARLLSLSTRPALRPAYFSEHPVCPAWCFSTRQVCLA